MQAIVGDYYYCYFLVFVADCAISYIGRCPTVYVAVNGTRLSASETLSQSLHGFVFWNGVLICAIGTPNATMSAFSSFLPPY